MSDRDEKTKRAMDYCEAQIGKALRETQQWTDIEMRKQEMLAAEMEQPLRWMYLSFADDSRGGFLGAVIIKAHGIGDASVQTHNLKINPGGELLAFDITEAQLPAESYRYRLLSRKEIQEFWPDSKTIREFEEEETRP